MASSRVYNLLVAEDEQFQRLALLDILTLCDYEGTQTSLIFGFYTIFSFLVCKINVIIVTAVDNGKLALQELRDESKDFDLVLLDLYMPEMDGFELLSLMQEEDRLSAIPVVVMSADGDKEIIANCLSTY